MVAPGYDNGDGRRRWRALDQGPVKVRVEADAPRVDCPEHGPTVIQVPWARHNARHTRMLDAAVVWMVRCAAKSVVAMFFRIAWPTVGMMIGRFVAEADTAAGDPTPRTLGVWGLLVRTASRVLYLFLSLFSWRCCRSAGMDGARVPRRAWRAVPRSAAPAGGAVSPS